MSTGPEWHSWAAVGVTVHLRTGVTLASTIHAEENRVVLHVQGTNSADVALFVNRADLDRLVDAVTAARDELDAAIAAATIASEGPVRSGATVESAGRTSLVGLRSTR